MNGNGAVGPERIRERLAGQNILVTGSTGFLAKVFVEKLLRAVDTIGGVHLLVRGKSGGASPRQRVLNDVLRSTAFDRLRASLGDRFRTLCDEKISVVGGDLTRDRFGLDQSAYDALAGKINLVVNSAATVTFDERIDWAVDLNTLGPQRLLQFAKHCGDVPFLHVSTCYVCGVRKGVVPEDMAPPPGARDALPRRPGTDEYDLDGLIESLRAEAAEIRHRFAADPDACRQQLIDAGMNRARQLGWNDTYTFTKWLGEQLLARERGRVPLVIFRPAIIEGSYDEPTPGWIDGLRMADPIIVAYGRKKLVEFPGEAHVPLDLIPVDFVANAMIATLPVGRGRRGELCVYQVGSSDRNTNTTGQTVRLLERAFRKRPMNDDEGRPIRPKPFRLPPMEVFNRKWERRKRWLAGLHGVVKRLPLSGRRVRGIGNAVRRIDQLLYFAKIYAPYTTLDCRFADDNLRAAGSALHADDRAAFPFDATRIDWEEYLVNRHVPGLRAYVLGTGYEPSRRLGAAAEVDDKHRRNVADILQGATLFDAFARAAKCYGHEPALQIRRGGRWLRYTYDEALQATGAILCRLTERGLRPGDRVALCAESSPEWGLTYLALMRGGMTAIPLDPQLPPDAAWSAARFAEAKLMCASTGTAPNLTKAKAPSDAELVVMTEPFIPRPAASRDAMPDPVVIDDNAVASILFTSGTTISPKAVQLTHRNLLANARALVQVHPVSPDDELLSVLPMYHAFEFTGGFLVPMLCGATITYVDQLKGPDIVSAMQATGTTVMLVVPRLLRMFLDSIERGVAEAGTTRRSLFKVCGMLSEASGRRWGRALFRPVHQRFGGRLRLFVCGGSRLEPDLFHAFARLGFQVCEGYGLTETSPVLTVNPPNAARAGSVGPPLPNVELEVRNTNLENIGEIWVRGASVMSGYLKNEEATGEVLVDGWLRTGDLGRVDENGFVHLTGRSKDLIITGAGKNVYPDEVEVFYQELPYVKELCVFGMPAEDGLGDVVHAVCVLDRDAAPDLDRSSIEREIRLAAATISESLAPHQRIAMLHFWERDLPKTSTLKAKRGLIRDMVASESGGPAADSGAAATPTADEPRASGESWDALRSLLASHSRQPADGITPSMHLHLDLGVDSIGKLELLGAVEAKFGVRIDNEAGAKVARVADLLRLVGDRAPTGAAATTNAWQRRLERDGNGSAPAKPLPAPLLPMRWMVRGGIAAFMNSYVRVHSIGRENIPKKGGFLLAPNHASHLDTPAVLIAAGSDRRVWTAGAEDYFFSTPVKRLVFGKLLDTIPFDRHADGFAGLRRCGEALRRGDGLLLFPEGTRSITGDLQPFKIGVAVLAIERGVPVVPVHIDRAFDLFPKGSRMVRPGSITVRFGEPIVPPPRDAITDYYSAFRDLTRDIEKAVTTLAAQATEARR